MRLSARLRAVADMIPPCEALYDVGADHGRLPACMLLEGRCERAVACDISADSLGKAVALLTRLGLAGRAEFHLGDGLRGLAPAAADCVAICGLGARTMLDILPPALPCPIVLSTHVDLEALRSALPGRGYRVERERLVREDRRFYAVMRIAAGEDAPCEGADAYIGRGLRGDPLLADYIAWRERVAKKAAQGGDPAWEERLGWIEEAKGWLKDG